MFIIPHGNYIPAFMIGILLKNKYLFVKKYVKIIALVTGGLFILAQFFWKGYYLSENLDFIQWHTLSFNNQNIQLGLFHLFIGFSGSIFFFTLFQVFYRENWIIEKMSMWGKYSLGIYILQVIIIETILTKYVNIIDVNIWIYSIVMGIILAIIEMIICLYIISIIHKNKFVEKILFGTSYEKYHK